MFCKTQVDCTLSLYRFSCLYLLTVSSPEFRVCFWLFQESSISKVVKECALSPQWNPRASTCIRAVATCGCQGVTGERRLEGCGETQCLRKQELHCSHCAEVLDEISASCKVSSPWSEWYIEGRKSPHSLKSDLFLVWKVKIGCCVMRVQNYFGC